MEYWIGGRMLKENLDVYLPLVDDDAIDAIIKRPDGTFASVQIKARSKDVGFGAAALFAGIPHVQVREDYWFVFYSERIDATWIMTSKEFFENATRLKHGANAGKFTIWFNGRRQDPQTGESKEYCLPRWQKYLAMNFDRIARVKSD